MDLSILCDEQIQAAMDDDSFLVSRSEAMDDEVTQIFKKWKLNNPLSPKKDATGNIQNETFDSRTFTRPSRRKTFNSPGSSVTSNTIAAENSSLESGIASINLQVGGAFTPMSMQRSWLGDVSPPGSICSNSIDFQNNDNMLNSLITSSDFSNVSFLLNGNDAMKDLVARQMSNNTMTIENSDMDATPTNQNATRNLMDFTFDVNKTTITRVPKNSTFVTATDIEPPLKEIGIENADMQLNDSTEDFGKNLTFNKYENGNITWNKVPDVNTTIVQSTPLHNPENQSSKEFHNHSLSPITSFRNEDNDFERDGDVLLRNFKSRKLIDEIQMEDYRNSIEDQCEFLLNEETIKLSSRVCGESFDDLKNALITSSTDANEREFDKILDSFNVKKLTESEKLLQSVDNIKQRHSLINMEKQREEKQRRDSENDNRMQYDSMNKSSERLLNRRSRLFDNVNLQLQQAENFSSLNGSANMMEKGNEAENDEVVDKNDRDRFKTIKLSKPRFQNGMIIVDSVSPEASKSEVSPGANKERQNQINQQKQEDVEFKRPAPSKLSKFGFSHPTYRSRNDLNLPLKASSTDSLDNDSSESSKSKKPVTNLKSPMGIKSKSIHNLMFNGAQNGKYTSNLKLSSDSARSQSNLKGSRASSLVRPSMESNYKIPQNNQLKVQPANRKPTIVRPSSGYYGNTFNKRFDSDNESCSLSSSSASSRNSVHLSLAPEQIFHQNSLQSAEELNQTYRKPLSSGTVSKPGSGIARSQASGLPRPQIKSGLPRPKR